MKHPLKALLLALSLTLPATLWAVNSTETKICKEGGKKVCEMACESKYKGFQRRGCKMGCKQAADQCPKASTKAVPTAADHSAADTTIGAADTATPKIDRPGKN